ncbi:MAG: hypothetical protein RR908_06710 [Rikenellaceae bacterium]
MYYIVEVEAAKVIGARLHLSLPRVSIGGLALTTAGIQEQM